MPGHNDTQSLSTEGQLVVLMGKVEEHNRILKGNGQEGLEKQMVRVDEKLDDIKTIKKLAGAILVAVILGALGFTAKVIVAAANGVG